MCVGLNRMFATMGLSVDSEKYAKKNTALGGDIVPIPGAVFEPAITSSVFNYWIYWRKFNVCKKKGGRSLPGTCE